MTTDNKIGLWTSTALVVGNIIGAGIFLLPVSLAPLGLVSSLAAWVFTATGVLMLAMVYAGLSRGMPGAKGPHTYVKTAFGELPAFLVIWSYWIGTWVGNAAIATGMTSYLSSLFPVIGERPGLAPIISLSAVWLLTGVNILGTRKAGGVQMITTICKLLPLLLVAAGGIYMLFTDATPMANTLHASTPLGLGAFTAAAALMIWPLMGFESASVASERVRNPLVTIPRATMIGTLVVAGIYLLSAGTVQAMLAPDALAASNAPFADAAGLFFGNTASRFVAIFVAISAFGALNGWTLLMGELPYQLAVEGVFPKIFAKQSRFQTPAVSLVISSLLVTALVGMNFQKSMGQIFQYAVLISSVSTLVLYLICALAALKLLRLGVLQLPAGQATRLRFIAVGGFLFAVWATLGAGISVGAGSCDGGLLCWTPWRSNAVYMGTVLLLAGLPVYFLMQRGRMKSTGVPS
jgi:APA family basic amino acid/polyamine antiporter